MIILSPRFDGIIHLFCLYWDLNPGLSWSILTSLTADHILQCNQGLPSLNQHSTAPGTSNIINTIHFLKVKHWNGCTNMWEHHLNFLVLRWVREVILFPFSFFYKYGREVYFSSHSTAAPLAFLDVRAARPCRTIFNNCGFMVITYSWKLKVIKDSM